MIVRAATDADLAWLTQTGVAAYQTVFRPLLPKVDWQAFDDAFFMARIARDIAHVRIAARDDLRLGFSLLTGTHLDMLFVAADQRGAGVGRNLLESAQTLECFAANTAARRFYERENWQLERCYARPFGGVACDFVAYVKGSR